MSIQTNQLKETTINNHVYKGQYIPASKAILIAYQLASLGSNGDIKNLLASGDDNLILQILSCTTRDDEAVTKANFDKIFTGNLNELLLLLQFVIAENFGDFLQKSGTGLLKARTQQEPQEISEA
jgi:hypothetical protein